MFYIICDEFSVKLTSWLLPIFKHTVSYCEGLSSGDTPFNLLFAPRYRFLPGSHMHRVVEKLGLNICGDLATQTHVRIIFLAFQDMPFDHVKMLAWGQHHGCYINLGA